MNGHLPVVRLLIDAKAKLDAVDDSKYQFSCFKTLNLMKSLYFCVNRFTAVYWAAYNGHAKVVHWLAKVRYYVSVRLFHVRDILI